MTRTVFPKWAPPSLIEEYEKIELEQTQICRELGLLNEQQSIHSLEDELKEDLVFYLKLLTDFRMESVWKRAKALDIRPVLLSSYIKLALLRPEDKTSMMTPDQHREWLKKVRKSSEELADLIHESGFDELAQSIHFEKLKELQLVAMSAKGMAAFAPSTEKIIEKRKLNNYADKLLEKHYEQFKPQLLSEYLSSLTYKNEEDSTSMSYFHQPNKNTRLGRPNALKADRAYFIKKITEQLLKQTGKPCRKIVATLVEVFFEDVVDERQLRELTNNKEGKD